MALKVNRKRLIISSFYALMFSALNGALCKRYGMANLILLPPTVIASLYLIVFWSTEERK